ncbi:MAG: CDP-glucose 4,6-dehydratase, partial [Treponema sp.]|nr:CDP-glucose 4,6-dehydratase [Treponema sp.]
VRASYKDPVGTYETNVMGTVNVLEAVRACPSVRSFVNVTTDKVYLNREWAWGYRENEELCGFDPYSNSKSCSELVTYSYRNSFFNEKDAPAISTARSGNVIGGGDYAVDRIVPDCIRAVEAGKEIILRNPNSTRPYQHVLECLRGYLALAKAQYDDKASVGSYNFGPDDESCVTTGQLATLFCDAWGSGASWKNVSEEDAPHEANFLKLDCSKSKAVLGWKPQWGIKQAIEKIVEWEKAVQAGTPAAEITDKQIKEYFER